MTAPVNTGALAPRSSADHARPNASRPVVEMTVLFGDRKIVLTGRLAWALNELINAGLDGCTPITHPGPRWSGYVHRLKKDYGFVIETVTEMHSGAYAGKHARYVLHSDVTVLSVVREGDKRNAA